MSAQGWSSYNINFLNGFMNGAEAHAICGRKRLVIAPNLTWLGNVEEERRKMAHLAANQSRRIFATRIMVGSNTIAVRARYPCSRATSLRMKSCPASNWLTSINSFA